MLEKPAEHVGKRKDGCSLLGCDVILIAPLWEACESQGRTGSVGSDSSSLPGGKDSRRGGCGVALARPCVS